MIESERHRVILSAVQARPVVTVAEIADLTEASEATVRRDIATLHMQKKVRRVRGGVEGLAPPQFVGLSGRPFATNATRHTAEKRAIAQRAVEMCADGDAIIVNGGTTTFQMVHPLANRRCLVLTNSFPIAEHLLKQSKNTVMLTGGTIYREQNIVLSPFDNDVTRNFAARRMFLGAQGVSRLGVMEQDPLIIQAETKLIGQAEEVVLMVDSSKFRTRSSLILCPLERITTLITDDGLTDDEAVMIEAAGVTLVVVPVARSEEARTAG